ncbi:cellulase family glycosylhydrolase [Pseudonocardia saturnea]
MTTNRSHSRRGSGPSRRLLGVAVAAAALAVAGAVPALATSAGPETSAATSGPAAPGLVALPDQQQPPPDDPGDDPDATTAPADDPADAPADAPADEPTDRPADEPADAPADEPAADPADDPAADPADAPAAEPGDPTSTDDPPADEDPAAPGDTATDPADDPAAADDPSAADDPAATDAMPAITVEGNQIMRDGQPWWFLGYNSFVWSGDCGNDDEKMTAEDVDTWFEGMRHDGHGAVRLFFYDGWDVERLDAAVESAKEHNVYLTITLDDAIGGCGENDKEASWFADQSERETFQNHMEMLLERYRGETTFAWFEFFNEPDYVDGALREFYDEMGAIADTIDPDRLFSSGTVAPYWVDGEDNFLDIHESPGVDIASMHEYDEGEVESNHGPGVRANSAGKPVIVGEYGIEAGEDCDNSYQSRADRFAEKIQIYTDTTIGYAGAFAWSWQPGGDNGCGLGNLDSDTASQDTLRDFDLAELIGQVRDTVGDAVGGDTPGDTADEDPADSAGEDEDQNGDDSESGTEGLLAPIG